MHSSRLAFLLKYLLSPFRDLLYPRTCIVCLNHCEKDLNILCRVCFDELSFISPLDRCHRCFQEILSYHDYKGKPHTCFEPTIPITRYGFCFESSHVVSSLLQFFQSHSSENTCQRSLASFFAIQHIRLQFPKPDALILLPSTHSIFQKKEFGKEVCRILDIPTCYFIHTDGTYRMIPTHRMRQNPHKRALFISKQAEFHSMSFFSSLLSHEGIRTYDWLTLKENN